MSGLNEPWPFIFFLENVRQVNIDSEALHVDIRWNTYYPQSFTRAIDERQEMIINQHGSLAAALGHHQQHNALPDPDGVETQASELLGPDQEPELVEEQTYSEQEQLVRSQALRGAVREAHDDRCAFCGAERRTVSSTLEVEATHIYPRSEGGADDVRNGLALCKLHHWAFDSGRLSVDTDYQILLRDLLDRETHREFRNLEGSELNLPEKERHYPHPKFLEAHRELNGFE